MPQQRGSSAMPGSNRLSRSFGEVRAAFGNNIVLLLNSSAITIGSGCNAALGFVYWWVAARAFSAEAVGTSAALISLMGLLGPLGEVGLGTLFIGGALGRRGREHGLITAALLITAVASGILGLAYVALTTLWSFSHRNAKIISIDDALFVAGCAATGIAQIADYTLVGLLQGGLQLLRNAAFSVIKLLFLVAGAMGLFAYGDTSTILLAWVAGLGLSVLLVCALARRQKLIAFCRPDFRMLLPMVTNVVDHHALNIAALAPTMVFPFLVALIFSPAVNAAFFPAWSIVNTAVLFPAALTTVLYRVGSEDPDAGGGRLGFSLILSTLFSLAMGLMLFLCSQTILGLFNPAYPEIAGPSLRLLGFGVVGLSIRCHYIALMRLRGQMRRASVRFALWSGLEIGLACLGGSLAGLEGFTIGWLLAISAQAASMLRPLLTAVDWPSRRGGRETSANYPPSAVTAQARPLRMPTDEQDQRSIRLVP